MKWETIGLDLQEKVIKNQQKILSPMPQQVRVLEIIERLLESLGVLWVPTVY